MGFAGQVFAARVAVGLALPTPSQLESSGGMIANFANKLYGRLRSQQADNAKKSLEVAKNHLTTVNAALTKAAEESRTSLSSAAHSSIAAISAAYSKTPKMETTEGMNKFLAAAQAAPGDLGVKMEPLFANIDKDATHAEKYSALIEALMRDTTGADAALMQWMRTRVKSLDLEIEEQRSRTASGELEGAEFAILVESAKLAKQDLDVMELHYGYKEKHVLPQKKRMTDAEKEVEKATKGVTDAQDELNTITEETTRGQHKLGLAVNKAAFEIKVGFQTALKESIAQLTAFYYKLNQNTQELIAFERELMNANSVFGLTNSELFEVGDTVTQFGQEFGLAMQNGAEGLYQLASAGVTAEQALAILPHTLKLSMAVQGDHNTISKLTAQTLFGFEMSMEKAGEVTDKFAHAIQKSLIEYQDLASAVKFALPFFTSTGQSIDQLLGALQVLTNRALEAGIAGRGLRQGVAELAESLGDASANFKRMGVEITDSQGNMLQLTEIAANFHEVLEEGVINDTELLTSLIQDLNVRGATAFVHLVQASDEFTAAVSDLENAGGELDEMVRIQNESLQAQIQILANNVQAIFYLRDASYEGTEYLNAFHEAVVRGIESLQGLLVELENGQYVLTGFGQAIQDVAVEGVSAMVDTLEDLVRIIKKFTQEGLGTMKFIRMLLVPLNVLLKVAEGIGPQLLKMYFTIRLLNMVFPIMTILQTASTVAVMLHAAAQGKDNLAKEEGITLSITEAFWLEVNLKNLHKRIWAALIWLPIKLNELRLSAQSNFLSRGQSIWDAISVGWTQKKILWGGRLNSVRNFSIMSKIKERVIDIARDRQLVTGMTWRSANLAVEWKTIWALYTKNKLKKSEILWEALGFKWLAKTTGLTAIYNSLTAFGIFLQGKKLKATRWEIIQLKAKYLWDKLINWELIKQNALTILGAIGWSAFWIAATGGIIILIAFFVVLAKKLNDQFDLLTQFKIFFEHIINMIGWYVQMWIDAGVALAEWAVNGTDVFLRFGLFVKHVFIMIGYYIDIAAEKLKDFLAGGLNPWGNIKGIPLIAAGKANVYGRQYGGSAYAEGGGAYVVGEKGPEMFIPRQSGQIIPNKDLNSARTNRLYEQSALGSQDIKAGSVIKADKLIVNDLKTRVMRSAASKLGIDIF